MQLRDDDEVTLVRPGRDSVKITWGQWTEKREVYEAAGFSVIVPEPPKIDPSRPAKIIKSRQEACLDDDPERWDDMKLIQQVSSLYSEREDFDHLPDNVNGFNYREWAKKFVPSIQSRFVLSDKQRTSAIKLYKHAGDSAP